MAGISLTLLVLKTRQMDRMRTIYSAFGIELIEEQHGKGLLHYAGRVGELVLELYPSPDDASSVDSTTCLGFAVENVTKVVDALQVIGDPGTGRLGAAGD